MMMIFALLSCPLVGGGSGGGGGGGRGGRSKKGRLGRNSRRQARTLSQVQLSQGCRMRGTGEDIDGGVGRHPQERQRGLGTRPILSR